MKKLLLAAVLGVTSLLAAEPPNGIWMGQTTGKNGEKQDIAFQFTVKGGIVAGILFGDEIDEPVAELKIDGDRITFRVGKAVYKGTIGPGKIELEREPNQKIVLRKLS